MATCNFIIFQPINNHLVVHYTATSGTLVLLGEGSWLYNGTAVGTNSAGGPTSGAWSFEYRAPIDTLFIATEGARRDYEGVTTPDPDVQVINGQDGKPVLVRIEKDVRLSDTTGDFSFRIRAGSYINF